MSHRKLRSGDIVEPRAQSGLRPGYGKVLSILNDYSPGVGGKRACKSPGSFSVKADMYFKDLRYEYYGQPLHYAEDELVRIGGYQLII